MRSVRIVTYRKRRQCYVFKYPEGDTGAVFEAAAGMAANPDVDFDYFDASVLAYWMGRLMEGVGEPAATCGVAERIETRHWRRGSDR